VEEPADTNMELGKSREYSRDTLEALGLPKPWYFEVWLRDRKRGIAGVVDIVAGSGRFEVVEMKAYRRRSFNHFRLQLMFYAYLATHCLGPVVRAHLVLGDSVRTYPVTEGSLREVSRAVGRVVEVAGSERPPPSPYAGSFSFPTHYFRGLSGEEVHNIPRISRG
jgi:CRISPR/Cas system-associated exonuclease Cas4 (RecB family)